MRSLATTANLIASGSPRPKAPATSMPEPAFHPELCLLDIGLPDSDGNVLVGRLRRMPETAGAMMAAVSGYGRQ